MPPLRPCLGWNYQPCPTLVRGPKNRCPTHERQYEAWRTRDRPGPRARGYDREYEGNRAWLRANATPVCGRCKGWIDRDLPDTDPQGWTAGHIIALRNGGSSALSNLRPEHNLCNNLANARDAR